jgi:hypothetical protein
VDVADDQSFRQRLKKSDLLACCARSSLLGSFFLLRIGSSEPGSRIVHLRWSPSLGGITVRQWAVLSLEMFSQKIASGEERERGLSGKCGRRRRFTMHQNGHRNHCSNSSSDNAQQGATWNSGVQILDIIVTNGSDGRIIVQLHPERLLVYVNNSSGKGRSV